MRKSTAGQLMANMIPSTAGDFLYRGNPSGRWTGRQGRPRREIQMVMQDPNASLNPKHKIGWIIEEPLHIHFNYSKAQCARLVAETLELVGLDESHLSRYPHELSGGQRQRVSIAAALMLGPRLLIADEVVSALDVSIQAQILNLLKKLQATKNLTYLFISHDLNVVQYMSDRIGVRYLGQLVEVGSVDDVYGAPCHPYTQVLLSVVPTIGETRRQHITIHGEVPLLLKPPSGCPFHPRCPRAENICATQIPLCKDLGNGHIARCHFAEP